MSPVACSKPRNVFGVSLKEQQTNTKLKLPDVFLSIINWLSFRGLSTPDLFCLSSHVDEVNALCRRFESNNPKPLEHVRRPVVVGGLLKRWLETLPEPLVPSDIQGLLMEAPLLMSEPLKTNYILQKILYCNMEPLNLLILRQLLLLLYHYCQESSKCIGSPGSNNESDANGDMSFHTNIDGFIPLPSEVISKVAVNFTPILFPDVLTGSKSISSAKALVVCLVSQSASLFNGPHWEQKFREMTLNLNLKSSGRVEKKHVKDHLDKEGNIHSVSHELKHSSPSTTQSLNFPPSNRTTSSPLSLDSNSPILNSAPFSQRPFSAPASSSSSFLPTTASSSSPPPSSTQISDTLALLMSDVTEEEEVVDNREVVATNKDDVKLGTGESTASAKSNILNRRSALSRLQERRMQRQKAAITIDSPKGITNNSDLEQANVNENESALLPGDSHIVMDPKPVFQDTVKVSEDEDARKPTDFQRNGSLERKLLQLQSLMQKKHLQKQCKRAQNTGMMHSGEKNASMTSLDASTIVSPSLNTTCDDVTMCRDSKQLKMFDNKTPSGDDKNIFNDANTAAYNGHGVGNQTSPRLSSSPQSSPNLNDAIVRNALPNMTHPHVKPITSSPHSGSRNSSSSTILKQLFSPPSVSSKISPTSSNSSRQTSPSQLKDNVCQASPTTAVGANRRYSPDNRIQLSLVYKEDYSPIFISPRASNTSRSSSPSSAITTASSSRPSAAAIAAAAAVLRSELKLPIPYDGYNVAEGTLDYSSMKAAGSDMFGKGKPKSNSSNWDDSNWDGSKSNSKRAIYARDSSSSPSTSTVISPMYTSASPPSRGRNADSLTSISNPPSIPYEPHHSSSSIGHTYPSGALEPSSIHTSYMPQLEFSSPTTPQGLITASMLSRSSEKRYKQQSEASHMSCNEADTYAETNDMPKFIREERNGANFQAQCDATSSSSIIPWFMRESRSMEVGGSGVKEITGGNPRSPCNPNRRGKKWGVNTKDRRKLLEEEEAWKNDKGEFETEEKIVGNMDNEQLYPNGQVNSNSNPSNVVLNDFTKYNAGSEIVEKEDPSNRHDNYQSSNLTSSVRHTPLIAPSSHKYLATSPRSFSKPIENPDFDSNIEISTMHASSPISVNINNDMNDNAVQTSPSTELDLGKIKDSKGQINPYDTEDSIRTDVRHVVPSRPSTAIDSRNASASSSPSSPPLLLLDSKPHDAEGCIKENKAEDTRCSESETLPKILDGKNATESMNRNDEKSVQQVQYHNRYENSVDNSLDDDFPSFPRNFHEGEEASFVTEFSCRTEEYEYSYYECSIDDATLSRQTSEMTIVAGGNNYESDGQDRYERDDQISSSISRTKAMDKDASNILMGKTSVSDKKQSRERFTQPHDLDESILHGMPTSINKGADVADPNGIASNHLNIADSRMRGQSFPDVLSEESSSNLWERFYGSSPIRNTTAKAELDSDDNNVHASEQLAYKNLRVEAISNARGVASVSNTNSLALSQQTRFLDKSTSAEVDEHRHNAIDQDPSTGKLWEAKEERRGKLRERKRRVVRRRVLLPKDSSKRASKIASAVILEMPMSIGYQRASLDKSLGYLVPPPQSPSVCIVFRDILESMVDILVSEILEVPNKSVVDNTIKTPPETVMEIDSQSINDVDAKETSPAKNNVISLLTHLYSINHDFNDQESFKEENTSFEVERKTEARALDDKERLEDLESTLTNLSPTYTTHVNHENFKNYRASPISKQNNTITYISASDEEYYDYNSASANTNVANIGDERQMVDPFNIENCRTCANAIESNTLSENIVDPSDDGKEDSWLLRQLKNEMATIEEFYISPSSSTLKTSSNKKITKPSPPLKPLLSSFIQPSSYLKASPSGALHSKKMPESSLPGFSVPSLASANRKASSSARSDSSDGFKKKPLTTSPSSMAPILPPNLPKEDVIARIFVAREGESNKYFPTTLKAESFDSPAQPRGKSRPKSIKSTDATSLHKSVKVTSVTNKHVSTSHPASDGFEEQIVVQKEEEKPKEGLVKAGGHESIDSSRPIKAKLDPAKDICNGNSKDTNTTNKKPAKTLHVLAKEVPNDRVLQTIQPLVIEEMNVKVEPDCYDFSDDSKTPNLAAEDSDINPPKERQIPKVLLRHRMVPLVSNANERSSRPSNGFSLASESLRNGLFESIHAACKLPSDKALISNVRSAEVFNRTPSEINKDDSEPIILVRDEEVGLLEDSFIRMVQTPSSLLTSAPIPPNLFPLPAISSPDKYVVAHPSLQPTLEYPTVMDNALADLMQCCLEHEKEATTMPPLHINPSFEPNGYATIHQPDSSEIILNKKASATDIFHLKEKRINSRSKMSVIDSIEMSSITSSFLSGIVDKSEPKSIINLTTKTTTKEINDQEKGSASLLMPSSASDSYSSSSSNAPLISQSASPSLALNPLFAPPSASLSTSTFPPSAPPDPLKSASPSCSSSSRLHAYISPSKTRDFNNGTSPPPHEVLLLGFVGESSAVLDLFSSPRVRLVPCQSGIGPERHVSTENGLHSGSITSYESEINKATDIMLSSWREQAKGPPLDQRVSPSSGGNSQLVTQKALLSLEEALREKDKLKRQLKAITESFEAATGVVMTAEQKEGMRPYFVRYHRLKAHVAALAAAKRAALEKELLQRGVQP